MHHIKLNAEDAVAAAGAATIQILRKIHQKRRGDHGGRSARSMRERFADGIHGTMGEIALSRALNIAWTPGGLRISRGDVGNRIEVRATEHTNGHLIVYEDESDNSPFVLMIGHYPLFRIAGYIMGRDAKQPEWFNPAADPPSFWVPQSALIDIERLTL